MIKYTERNAKKSRTRSQLELKSKLVWNKSNLQTTRYPISRKKIIIIRQCCLIRAALKCVIL